MATVVADNGQPSRDHTEPVEDLVPLREATKAWFKISLQTFGGPAGQIAVMQTTLVDEKKWIGQNRFLHALNFCHLLPGPEAQQLAVYTGWLLNGTRGGIIAGGLFVLPGMLALLLLSAIYVAFGDTGVVSAVLSGVAPAVVAIVAQAVLRVSKRALTGPAMVAVAVGSFAALTLFAAPFPLVIGVAALAGWLVTRGSGGEQAPVEASPDSLVADDAPGRHRPSATRFATVLGIGLLLWGAPLVALALAGGGDTVFMEQGLFFSGAAVVTFGGAYAVLAYVAQQAVSVYHWLLPGEMVRGLALAESTPGPLIMVVQFVAFVGAYRDPGTLNPWVAAILASLLVTWVTFVPSFIFVLLGAPFMEALRNNRSLSGALGGITAAVVGVIANLAVYFALHTLFATVSEHRWGPLHLPTPAWASIDLVAVGLTAVACGLVFGRAMTPLKTLGICAALGLLVAGAAALF